MAETTKIPPKGRVWKDRETGVWHGESGSVLPSGHRGGGCSTHSWARAYKLTEDHSRNQRYRAFRKAGCPTERLPHFDKMVR